MQTKNYHNKLVVISGCSGGGKSTLLSELSKLEYTVVAEVGRQIVKEQQATNGKITPWENPKLFCELLIEKSVANYQEEITQKEKNGKVIFFERSFLEGISYLQTLNINWHNHFIKKYRYYHTVFMAPPWKEIFCPDAERKHSFEDAVTEFERLLKFYSDSGYQTIQLPKVSVKERVKFITSFLDERKNE